MVQIANFNVAITEEDKKYTITLSAEGDDFEVEVDDAGELIDEIEELIQERLSQYGIPTKQA